jgi:TonB-dependent receptor
MLQRLFTLGLFLLISSGAAFAQGSIAGTITDAKTGEAIIGANVVITGTTKGSATDIEGKYTISNVAAGTYDLTISYITYKTYVASAVVVENAKRVTVDIKLQEESTELAEVVVQAARQTDTDFELLKTIKEAKVIVVGISSEQIAKTLDRDAAQVLRRVPGITIKGDQFVQIRGLSERYNAVMLHNTYAPSVETDVRSFSFATLPSSQLDRVLVFKSPAADVPGDFAGGVVKVFTKSIPEENGIIIDYSTQVRAGTTFNDYYSQKKDATHFTGFNMGNYDLPANFPHDVNNVHNADQLTNVGRSLPNNWVPVRSTAIPDQRFALTFNRKFNIGKVQVGNITALNYSNAYSIFNVTRNDYTTGTTTNDQNFGFSDVQYNQQIRTGFLFNWAFKFNPRNLIEFKNLYNQSSNDQWVDRTGTGISDGQLNGAFDKVYRGIYSGQLMGTHDLFNDKTKVEWVAGYNNSNRDQPDYRRYRTNYDPAAGVAYTQIPNTVDPNFLGRFFSKMNETAYSGGLSVTQLFGAKDPLLAPEIKVGAFYEHKERTFSARNVGYVRSPNFDNNLTSLPLAELMEPKNINPQTGLILGEISYRKNSYSAQNDLMAGYAMGSLHFGEKVKLDAGVRVENNIQQLHSFDDFQNMAVNPKYDITRVLPSANLAFNLNPKSLIRAAYGETLNRPEFRELAPFSFYDFNFNFLYVGNPGLKTAKVQNVDLRWELFPSKTELVTLGGFYKNFINPIEFLVDINSPGGGLKNVYYVNAQGAVSYGVELEIKKSLQGLTGSSLIDKINVLVNASVIKSKINIPANLAADQDANRPMQGQAPYVVNAALFYNNEDNGWQVNALYNVVGKSIAFVGNTQYHTVYLMPRNVVDLTFSKTLNQRFTLKGGISDILNQPMLFLQDGNNNGKLERKTDNVVQKYKPGQVFSIGFSFRI